jgi:hypothetical protein
VTCEDECVVETPYLADENNCGTCGHVCSANHLCFNGQCFREFTYDPPCDDTPGCSVAAIVAEYVGGPSMCLPTSGSSSLEVCAVSAECPVDECCGFFDGTGWRRTRGGGIP